MTERRFKRARSASSRSRGRTSSPAIGGCRRRRRRSFAPTAISSPATSRASIGNGYIHIVGRAKDLVISGGFNVYPKEVESEIDAIEGVLESAVFGVAHADFGEGVTAAVVAASGSGADRAGDPGRAWRQARQVQGAEAHHHRRIAAAQRDGQGAEGGAARSVQGHLPRLRTRPRGASASRRPKRKAIAMNAPGGAHAHDHARRSWAWPRAREFRPGVRDWRGAQPRRS